MGLQERKKELCERAIIRDIIQKIVHIQKGPDTKSKEVEEGEETQQEVLCAQAPHSGPPGSWELKEVKADLGILLPGARFNVISTKENWFSAFIIVYLTFKNLMLKQWGTREL